MTSARGATTAVLNAADAARRTTPDRLGDDIRQTYPIVELDHPPTAQRQPTKPTPPQAQRR